MTDVVLYQFPGAFGFESLSPFCTKLGAYLRLAGIEHRVQGGNPQQAPKGKLPYLGLDGELIGDSGLVIERLKARFGDPLDAALSKHEHALGHLARRAAEEHLYWGALHVRWDDDALWKATYRATIASMLPAAVRWFLPGILRGGVRKSLRAHGLGRHTRAEITAACARDLDAFAELLGDRPFLLAEAPSSYDCSVYAMIAHLARTPGEHPLVRAVHERPTLLAYCERMDARIGWPAQ